MPAGSLAGSRAAFASSKKIDAQIGAGHAEYPVGKRDVLRRDFQQVRREAPALSMIGAPGLVQRSARHGQRARAAGKPRRRAVGVAHDHIDAVGIDAELVGDELLV